MFAFFWTGRPADLLISYLFDLLEGSINVLKLSVFLLMLNCFSLCDLCPCTL